MLLRYLRRESISSPLYESIQPAIGESEPKAASTISIIASVSIESISTLSLKSAFSRTVAITLPTSGIGLTSLSIQFWITAPFDESNALTTPFWSTSTKVGISLYHLMYPLSGISVSISLYVRLSFSPSFIVSTYTCFSSAVSSTYEGTIVSVSL